MDTGQPPGLAILSWEDDLLGMDIIDQSGFTSHPRPQDYDERAVLKQRFIRVIETGATEFMTVIQASRDASGIDNNARMCSFDELSLETSTDATKTILNALGLDPSAACHWKRLGLAQWVGYPWSD